MLALFNDNLKETRPFLITDNATRYCNNEGKWDDLTNYEKCQHIMQNNRTCSDMDFDVRCSADATSIIYYVGYTISLLALTLAVIVFINFK